MIPNSKGNLKTKAEGSLNFESIENALKPRCDGRRQVLEIICQNQLSLCTENYINKSNQEHYNIKFTKGMQTFPFTNPSTWTFQKFDGSSASNPGKQVLEIFLGILYPILLLISKKQCPFFLFGVCVWWWVVVGGRV